MPNKRRRLRGIVVSDKMQKTVVVRVETVRRHPLYNKVVHSAKKYLAHDETDQIKVGDFVQIVESRPLSKRKRWAVEKVLGHQEMAMTEEVNDDTE
jgi:small subunit ribosomal protein S17